MYVHVCSGALLISMWTRLHRQIRLRAFDGPLKRLWLSNTSIQERERGGIKGLATVDPYTVLFLVFMFVFVCLYGLFLLIKQLCIEHPMLPYQMTRT